jgi:hypothetical protein
VYLSLSASSIRTTWMNNTFFFITYNFFGAACISDTKVDWCLATSFEKWEMQKKLIYFKDWAFYFLCLISFSTLSVFFFQYLIGLLLFHEVLLFTHLVGYYYKYFIQISAKKAQKLPIFLAFHYICWKYIMHWNFTNVFFLNR